MGASRLHSGLLTAESAKYTQRTQKSYIAGRNVRESSIDLATYCILLLGSTLCVLCVNLRGLCGKKMTLAQREALNLFAVKT